MVEHLGDWMDCPNCASQQPDWADVCIECGAPLSFLREHPHRVGLTIWASMLIGLGLLVALLTRVLDQLLSGAFPALGWIEAVGLGLGVVLSMLGARAWAALRDILINRVPSRSRR